MTIAEIQRAVADRYGLSVVELRGPSRHHSVSHPRQMAMYLARELTPHSFRVIGHWFGDRDHSTVWEACRIVRGRMAEHRKTALAIADLHARLALDADA